MKNTPVTIVGAGMAGLVLARTLQRAGVPVIVYDQEPGPHVRTQGGMLDIHDDSGRAALRAAGLEERFDALVDHGGEARRVLDRHGTVRWSSTGPAWRPEIERGALRDLLLDSLLPGTVRWRTRVTAVRPAGGGAHELRLSDGSTSVAELVVGADGAWSRVRAAVADAPARYTGVTSVEACLHDVGARHRDAAEVVGAGNFFVPGLGAALLGHHEATGTIRTRAVLDVDEGWAARDTGDVLEHFDGWAPVLRSLVADTDTELIVRPLHALPVGARWAPRAGITLVGDAAHLTTPFAGLGANVAMLDGARLAAALLAGRRDVGEAANTADVGEAAKTADVGEAAEAIAAYEADMFPRAEAAATESARNLEIVMHDPRPPRRFLDLLAAEEPVAAQGSPTPIQR